MSGTWSNPATPNLADFTTFTQNDMGISTAVLPATSNYLAWSFAYAMAVVLNGAAVPSILYVLAVYNLAGHRLLLTAQDQPGQQFFGDVRAAFGLGSFASGVVMAATDNGTGSTLATPEALKTLTIGQLGLVKTPYGRAYLEYAQSFGPSIWGVS